MTYNTTDTQQFCTPFRVLFVENAISCLDVCIRDVTNKARMCVKSFKNVTSEPFFALHWQRAYQHGCALEAVLHPIVTRSEPRPGGASDPNH